MRDELLQLDDCDELYVFQHMSASADAWDTGAVPDVTVVGAGDEAQVRPCAWLCLCACTIVRGTVCCCTPVRVHAAAEHV